MTISTITLNANTTNGPLMPVDLIGGNSYPLYKLTWGAVDAVNQTSVASPLPVQIITQPANSALASGANVIGRVGIDQTTPGTTDAVTVKAVGAIGALNETAPANDTASSGLNGRLQRVAQNLSSLIALLPASLGIKTAAASLSVAPASDAVFSTRTRNFTLTSRSGTITAGNSAQTLAAANANRVGFMIQNLSAGSLWINELGANAVAGQPSIEIKTGATYSPDSSGVSLLAISIIGATTGQAFTAREW